MCLNFDGNCVSFNLINDKFNYISTIIKTYKSMEDINEANNKVIVKASDILKKLKSPTDRKNFALENSKTII